MKKWLLTHSLWIKVVAPIIMAAPTFLDQYTVNNIPIDRPIWRAVFEKLAPTIPWIAILSGLIYAVVLFLEARSQPRIKNLTEKLVKAEAKNEIINGRVKDLFEGYLYNLANRLGFGSRQQNCERITLYIHDSNGQFTPCGRYSANPDFRQNNRTTFADNEGCIAKGWQHGWHFDANFPCPTNSKTDYIKYHLQHYNVSKNTALNLKMKSRLYGVSRIIINGKPLAVIVVESEAQDRFREIDIKDILQEQSAYLGNTIKELLDYIPRPSNAAEKGL